MPLFCSRIVHPKENVMKAVQERPGNWTVLSSVRHPAGHMGLSSVRKWNSTRDERGQGERARWATSYERGFLRKMISAQQWADRSNTWLRGKPSRKGKHQGSKVPKYQGSKGGAPLTCYRDLGWSKARERQTIAEWDWIIDPGGRWLFLTRTPCAAPFPTSLAEYQSLGCLQGKEAYLAHRFGGWKAKTRPSPAQLCEPLVRTSWWMASQWEESLQKRSFDKTKKARESQGMRLALFTGHCHGTSQRSTQVLLWTVNYHLISFSRSPTS